MNKNLFAVVTIVTFVAGCASVPSHPVISEEQQVTFAAGFDDVWHASINVLLDQGLEIDTRDYPPAEETGAARQGRIEAVKFTGKSLLKKYRQRLVVVPLTAGDGKHTVVAAKVVAETYSVGLLTEAAWRRSGSSDPALAENFITDLQTAVPATP